MPPPPWKSPLILSPLRPSMPELEPTLNIQAHHGQNLLQVEQ
jgi:hypothetical protein